MTQMPTFNFEFTKKNMRVLLKKVWNYVLPPIAIGGCICIVSSQLNSSELRGFGTGGDVEVSDSHPLHHWVKWLE